MKRKGRHFLAAPLRESSLQQRRRARALEFHCPEMPASFTLRPSDLRLGGNKSLGRVYEPDNPADIFDPPPPPNVGDGERVLAISGQGRGSNKCSCRLSPRAAKSSLCPSIRLQLTSHFSNKRVRTNTRLGLREVSSEIANHERTRH